MNPLADLVQRYYDAFNRRDLASYDRLFTRDCLIEAPGVQLRGIDGARGLDQAWTTAMPDGQIVSLHKTVGGPIVMCENRFRGRHTGPLVMPELTLPASGRSFDEAYVAVFEIEGERIKRQSLHFDRMQVVKVLGAPEAATPNVEAVRAIYAAFPRGDVPFILDQLDDDVSWGIDSVVTEVPAYGVRRGRADVARFFAAWGETADFHTFEAGNFVAAGDHVFNTLSYELTVKATGKRVKCSGSAQQWTLKNGKVIRWRGWEDTAATRDGYRP
jgi:ketosteroid isomerase-like protein